MNMRWTMVTNHHESINWCLLSEKGPLERPSTITNDRAVYYFLREKKYNTLSWLTY